MHLHEQQFSSVLEKFSFSSSFFGKKNAKKNAKKKKCQKQNKKKKKKKNVFEDKCFWSKMFNQIKMQAATNR